MGIQSIDICQTAAYLDSEAETPCVTCRNRPDCRPYREMRELFERNSAVVQQVPIIVRCSRVRSGWRPWSRNVDIRRRLAKDGVAELCGGCSVAECSTRSGLSDISRRALHEDGHVVEFSVVTCHAPLAEIVRGRDRLYQIAEPDKTAP